MKLISKPRRYCFLYARTREEVGTGYVYCFRLIILSASGSNLVPGQKGESGDETRGQTKSSQSVSDGLFVPLHGVCMGGLSMGDLLTIKTGKNTHKHIL